MNERQGQLLRVMVWLLAGGLFLSGCHTVEWPGLMGKKTFFSFEVTADMREFAGPQYQSSQYFKGVCEAIQQIGKGAFMVSPGDIDPPKYVSDTIREVLGEEYMWYPGVGNHEAETAEDMAWLRGWGSRNAAGFTRAGPPNAEETNYSFEYCNAHFVVLNQYYDGLCDTGTDGDISPALYQWLEEDLQAADKPFLFVFGHEPIVSVPDADSGRHRHQGDNLDAHPRNNHCFQQLLRKYDVTAYLCGHTHDFSYAKINGLWQLDAGHARGVGDIEAPSTFLKVFVGHDKCWVDVYRLKLDERKGTLYPLTRTIVLD